ncbi:hypothetical protein [Hydrogenophaga sp.]|uniref:DUF6933 domain-containing protein n=1 Tax=Hydrogenophaga sp. TaxID=1904254 RepID=UPI00271A2D4F|nr:hypothetical protein [Hydrogenophaga sp.]MDO9435729.1 hypothetical protein [Hydrogenophaga sp.]
MFTLRCTQKLLRRGLKEPLVPLDGPTTLLGDWYANILFVRPQQLVLCVSERTLLPVVLPVRDIATLTNRLPEAAAEVMAAVGVPPASIKAEVEAMCACNVGRTASKRVLGSLNEMVFLLEAGLQHDPERSLLQQSLSLAQTPLKLLEYDAPDRATQALFLSSEVLRTAREKRAS